MIWDYMRGRHKGKILHNNGWYVASTETKSSWFQTFEAANRFMGKNGYFLIEWQEREELRIK